MKRLFGRLLCLIGDHDWTSAALRGEPVTEYNIEAAIEYSRMYCSRCGKESRLQLWTTPPPKK